LPANKQNRKKKQGESSSVGKNSKQQVVRGEKGVVITLVRSLEQGGEQKQKNREPPTERRGKIHGCGMGRKQPLGVQSLRT